MHKVSVDCDLKVASVPRNHTQLHLSAGVKLLDEILHVNRLRVIASRAAVVDAHLNHRCLVCIE